MGKSLEREAILKVCSKLGTENWQRMNNFGYRETFNSLGLMTKNVGLPKNIRT